MKRRIYSLTRCACLCAIFLAVALSLQADDAPATALPATPTDLLAAANPGFENNFVGWTMNPPNSPMFQVNAAAASIGKLGLQAGTPGDTPNVAADLFSTRVPVQEGQFCRLTFWASFDARNLMCDVKLEFYDANGTPVLPVRTPGIWWADTVKYQNGCYPYFLRAIVPAGAVTAGAHISVRPRTRGVAYLDDFSLTQEPMPTTPTNRPPLISIAPLLADVAANPYNGKPPPKIVVKIDDLTTSALDKWQKVIDFAEIKKVKVNIGIICQSLKGDDVHVQKEIELIKNARAADVGEFWFHGWDHALWAGPDGKQRNEFDGRSYDEQKKRFDDSEAIVQEKLGFELTAFGAPGNGFDDNTIKVLAAEPAIKTFMYGDPKRPGGKVILERVGSVNIEQPTFFPRFDQFLAGYVHNRGRPYFVIQGHPWHWTDSDFNEFVQMIDFLHSQNVEFTTPSQLAADISGTASPPVETSKN